MHQTEHSIAAVLERFREFERLAAQMSMPRQERLNILNVIDSTYLGLSHGMLQSVDEVTPELERRLSYALPTMRRLATSSPLQSMRSAPRLHAA